MSFLEDVTLERHGGFIHVTPDMSLLYVASPCSFSIWSRDMDRSTISQSSLWLLHVDMPPLTLLHVAPPC